MPLTLPPDSTRLTVDRVTTGYGSTDFSLNGEDVVKVSTTARAGRPTDDGEIVINNDDYQYTTGNQQIDIADKLILVGDAPGIPSAFGEQAFGEGSFTGYHRIGTYFVLDWDIIEHPPSGSDLVLTVADFVFSVLSNRTVFYLGEGVPLSGSPGAALNTVLRENCPEIDRSALPDIPATIDYAANGKDADKVVDELAAYAADKIGPVVQTAFGNQLVFQPITDIQSRYSEPLPPQSYSPLTSSSESHDLVNEVRISGGIDDTGNVDDQQETVDHFVTVTNSNRLTHRIDTRKSEITSIQLYTRGVVSESDGVRVRLQVDDGTGTAPIAPEDSNSDIISSGTVDIEDVEDGWRKINLGEHDIPERNPWLIVDSNGETGHEVAVDSGGTPAYRALFPKPVAAQLTDGQSQNQYGTWESHSRNESLVTGEAIRQAARSKLDRNAWPGVGVGPVECITPDAHALQVGDVVEFDRPEHRAVGRFIVTKKTRSYADVTLRSKLTFQGVDDYV